MKQSNRSKSYEELEFTDDFMFCKILENNPKLCKELAEMITGENLGEIMKDDSQRSVRILPDGHGVRFDVYLSDGKTICDIEMQTTLTKGLPKRSRYYQSVIDIAAFEKNKDYTKLNKSFIIFITTQNPFPQQNLRMYTFVNMCREDNGLELGDDAIKIFLTPDGMKGDVSEDLEALMTYMTDKKTESDFTRELDEQIKIAKEGSSWRIEYMQMRERLEAQFNAGKMEGEKEGERKWRKYERIDMAKRMLSKGKYDYKEISELTGLQVEEIERLDKK